jgi:DNA-binding NtrC family response regulator
MPEYRVLLVDDEEELVSTLEERLLLRGINVETSTSGRTALKMLNESHFDIVVVDLKMPNLDGTAVIDTVRREHPEVKILLITGHGSGSRSGEEQPFDEDDVLLKPFDIETLLDRINQKLEE